MQIRRTAAVLTSAAALSLGSLALATPASAAPPVDQEGLININAQDITVQAPIAIAANLCDVTVAVLAQDLADGEAVCNASAESTATRERGSGDGPVQQNGLVNVNLTDVAVQIPISAAVNVCDVSVLVLATVTLPAEDVTCEAIADAVANA